MNPSEIRFQIYQTGRQGLLPVFPLFVFAVWLPGSFLTTVLTLAMAFILVTLFHYPKEK